MKKRIVHHTGYTHITGIWALLVTGNVMLMQVLVTMFEIQYSKEEMELAALCLPVQFVLFYGEFVLSSKHQGWFSPLHSQPTDRGGMQKVFLEIRLNLKRLNENEINSKIWIQTIQVISSLAITGWKFYFRKMNLQQCLSWVLPNVILKMML